MSEGLSPQLQQNIPGEAYCEKHQEPLRLFCENDQVTLCDKCFLSLHKNHTVCGVQQAAENYRKLFRELLNTLKEKLEAAKSLLAEEQERMVMVQGEEQNFKELVESEYKMMFRLMTEENETTFRNVQGRVFNLNVGEANVSPLMQFATELEEKSRETLQRLDSLGRENLRKLQESEVRLSEQICDLRQATARLEEKQGASPLALLKDARYCLEHGQSFLLQCLTPARIRDPSFRQLPGMCEMLEVLQRPITLDPETAHPCLILSEDRRAVRLRTVQQDVAGNPGRFDFSASVLGVESFTSGRHYWEVDVETATKWQLGVCEESASRDGVMPQASGEKILLTGSMMETICTFWVSPPLKRVSMGEQMHKVGVFLDCAYGQVSFYDVTKRRLIYNFSHLVFRGALRPVFSLCLPDGGTQPDSLRICLPEAVSYNVTVGPQPSSV